MPTDLAPDLTPALTPIGARTYSGAPLPLVALPAGDLLTVDEHEHPLLTDALGPGVHYRPGQPQTAGSYLYEPAGSVHTLYAPADNTEDTIIYVRVAGTDINFDDEGRFHSLLDAVSPRHLTDTLAAERGLDAPRYITGGATVMTGAR